MPTEEACIQLKPGKLFDSKTVSESGKVPVLNQSETGFLGYHDDVPGVVASPETPVVTFANHTCAIRLMKQPFSTIQNIFPKVGKPSVTDTTYFYYAALGRIVLSDYKGHHPLFRRAHIPVPPLPVQQRIVGILSAYDDLIENSQRRIRILEATARDLYREWFVHFRFPGHENHPRVTSSLGEIPEGWEGTFGDLATIERNGINPFQFPDEEFEHFSLPAFDNDRLPTIELGATILSGKYCIDDSTVLLSKLNPRIPRIWLPAQSGHRRAITSTEFLGLKPQPGVTREFIYAKCCSDEFAGQFGSLAIGTSTSHQRVKPGNLLVMPSTLPDRRIISHFTKLVSPMLADCQQLRSQIQNLRRTRDLLLPRLLSGQIDVKAA